MADSEHVTLTASTVTTVTLDEDYQSLEVVNVDGAAAVYFLVNPGATNPTVAGDGTIVLPAAIGSFEIHGEVAGSGATVVKLISTGTPKVAVHGW